MNQYAWQPHYAAAMLETIPSQRLITVAEDAIYARLHESLNGHPMSPSELHATKYALEHLCLLKREVEGLRLAS
jgi:hypothetical protein